MAGSVKVGVAVEGDSKGAVKAIDTTTKSVEELDKTTQKASRNVRKSTKDAEDGFTGMAKSAARMGAAIAAAGVAIGALILRKTFEETAIADAAMAQLGATIKSTGGAAGKTAIELSATATSLQKVTAYSDEAVIGAQSLLLTFKNIKGDQFDRATKAVLDLSTALHIDLNSAAKLAGKALNDPVKGLGALSKAGVQFTEGQKEMIAAMVEAGDVAKAQELILESLESRVGGSAEAYRTTLGGAVEGLKNAYGDLFEVEQKTSSAMVASINDLSATLTDSDIKSGIDALTLSFIKLADAAVKGLAAYGNYVVRVKENVAAAVGGIATDDTERLEKRVAGLTAYLETLTKSGQVAGTTVESIKAEIDELNKKLEVNAVLFGKSDKGLQAITVTAKRLNTETEKTAAVYVKSASATAKAENAQEKLNKRMEAAVKITDKTGEELAAMVKKTEDYIDAIIFEREQLGKSERQREIDNRLRAAGTKITAEQTQRIKEEAAALYDANHAIEEHARKQQEMADQQAALWSHLTTSMSDIFTGMVVDGKSSMDTLSDGFSAMIKKMLAEAAFNEIVIGFGGTAANGQNSTNSTFGQRATNAALTYGISEAISGAFTGFFGSKEDIEKDPVASAINKLADASWKPIEWLTGSSFSDVFGQKNDGNNSGSASFNLSKRTSLSGGSGKSFDQGNVDLAASLTEPLQLLADAIGGSSLTGTVTVGNKKGIQFRGQSFGQDIEAFLDSAFRAVIENATKLDAGLKSLLIAFEGTGEELGQFAGAIISISKNAGINSIAEAIEEFSDAGRTAYGVYKDTTNALSDQVSAFDGSLDSAMSLNDALVANKTAAYEFATSILAIGKALADIAESQARDIRESVLTAEQLTAKRTKERDALTKGLDTLIDPAKIEETTKRILELNKQIFDGLTEDQQKVRAEEFAKYAEKTSDVAQRILDKTLEDARVSQEGMNQRIADMLATAGGIQQQAANTQLQAANNMQAAVDQLQFDGITVNVSQSGGEVNVG